MAEKANAAKEETGAEGGNENLINDVIEKVSAIYQKNESVSYYETGELILAKIYEIENPEKYEWTLEDLKKKKKKSKIFRELQATVAKKLEGGADLPKKTFLYNAFNLVKEKQALKGNAQYESLSMVNRIALISVKDTKLKDELIEEIAKEELTSRKAKERIAERNGKSKKKVTIRQYINNPQKNESPDDSVIRNLNEKEKKANIDRANDRIKEINLKIASQQKDKELLEEFLTKLKRPVVVVSQEKKETEETVVV